MTFAKYPPVTTGEAIAVLKQDVELYHNIVHGDENTEVLTENGLVPSVDKVLKELLERIGTGTGADVTLRPDLAATNSTVSIAGTSASVIKKRVDNYTTPEAEGSLHAALMTGLPVILKANTDYIITETLNIPAKAVIIGPKSARLISEVDGYCAIVGDRASLAGFSARGEGANAKGFLIKANTGLQNTTGLEVVFRKEALEFETLGGSDFSSESDTWVTLTPSLYAIKMQTTPTTEPVAIPRKFINPSFGGSKGIDFGSCNDSFLSNCYTNGIKMSDASSKIMVTNVRIGAGDTSSVEIRGTNHGFTNFVPATPVNVYATDSTVSVAVVGDWVVNDFGTGNSINYKNRIYTPVFSSDGTQPNISDSALLCFYQRNGNTVRVSGQMTLSGTANMGTGNIFMSLPPNSQAESVGYDQMCQGNLEKIGPRPMYLATPIIAGDRTKVGFSYNDTSGTAIIEKFLGSSIVSNTFNLTTKAPSFVPDLDNAIDIYHYSAATGVTSRIWKDVGTKTFAITTTGVDTIVVTLNFTPAPTDYIIVELEQPARRAMQGAPLEPWPAGTVLRWAFSYNCK